LLFLLGARFIISDTAAFMQLLEARWLISVFILGPLLAVLSVNVALMISSRSSDPRVAQQVSTLIVMPFMLFFFGQVIGFLIFSNTVAILLTLVAALIDVILTYIAVRIFDREAILTRWA
jgi:ABC-2 type transport system permease protein